MTPEQVQEINRLRSLNLSPKQIARKLGLRPSSVTAFVRNQAEEINLARQARGELASVEHCLINEIAAQQLLEPKNKNETSEDDLEGGLAQIFVTRVEKNKYIVASYLVDYWCLGVKDALEPRKVNRNQYETMVEKSYRNFHQDYREISLEQAQSIIFGAVEYAAKLGLKPHRDFEKAKAHLGKPPEKLQSIEFGKEGQPFYINGPYDNAQQIINKLRETVGEGNFKYVMFAESYEDLFY
jgi:hypothetical protein